MNNETLLAYEGPARCHLCGSARIVVHNGEYVCMDCGTVLGPVYTYQAPRQEAPAVIKVNPAIRIRSTRLSMILWSQDASWMVRFREVTNILRRRYPIDEETIRQAKTLLKQLHARFGDTLTSYEIALTAIACAMKGRGVFSVVDAVRLINEEGGHKLSASRVLEALKRLSCIESTVDRARRYIDHVVGVLGLSEDVRRRAHEALSNIERRFGGRLGGMTPRVLAGVALRLAGVKRGLSPTLGIYPTSIRQAMRRLGVVQGGDHRSKGA